MMKTLRKNNKKILAIFTAMLMIAFIADTGYRRYNAPDTTGGAVVGKAGETELRANDVEVAETEVNILLRNALVQTNSREPGQQFVPLLQAVRMPDEVIGEWLDKPVTFALLKEEARRVPVTVDPRALDLFMEQLVVRLPDRRVVPAGQAGEFGQNVRASVADLMLVMEAFTRAADAVKVSRPLAMQGAVQGNQTVSVRYVPFDAKGLIDQAPQPTDEQLQAQFDKYKNDAATEFGTDANPLGVGYRYPPRVKFQSISVPRDQLKKVVKAKKDDYQWELDANKYYLQNQKEFARADALTATRPSTQPTTRPFAEVREQVLDKVMAPQVNALGEQVRKTIEDAMRADYEAWAKVQAPTTAPSTQRSPGEPASAGGTTQPITRSLNVPYESYEYLENLAAKIQQQYGVLPSTASVGEFKTEGEVSEMPGVGTVAQQAFYLAEPFVSTDKKNDPAVLSLFEPSQPRAGVDGAHHVIRVTATDPSHAPQSLAEVRDKVAEDFKRLWAWEQAKAEAQRVLAAAKTSGGLPAAAGDRPVITAGPFARFGFEDVKGLTFDDPSSRARFTTEAFKMVAQAAAAATQPAAARSATRPTTQPGAAGDAPVRLIELPAEMTVLAAELTSVNTNMDPANLAIERLRQPLQIRQEWQNRAMPRWLSYAGVAQRLGYVDSEEAARAEDAAAAR